MDWEATRADFPTLAKKTHLNTCSLGALPRQGREAVLRFLDLWEEHGASAWYKLWLGEAQAAREKFARLVNARSDEVALFPNVSSALSSLASAMPGGGNVVCAEHDFPTIPYQWHPRPDVEVRLARAADGVRTPVDAYAPLVDAQTRVVATSHVFYTSGYLADARALARLAHDNGALFLLDAYQATGQVPTDVRALGVDAYVTGGLKWLLGGPGIAFAYVRRELHASLSPAATGWFAHADQFAFDATTFTPRPDARRFELGTPAMAAVYAGSAGLDVVLRYGAEAIRRQTSALVTSLFERLVDAGYAVATPEREEERAGIVIVRLADPARVVKALAEEGFLLDYRPGKLRVSPYFYNTEPELDRFVARLRAIAPPQST